MKTIYFNESLSEMGPCVATIGMFDGVHRGHRFVISCLQQEAEQQGLPSCVITFDRHPKAVVGASFVPQALSTLDEKLVLLSQTDIDLCVVLPFTSDMAQLTAHDFMQQVLKQRLGVRTLLTGYDNHFGHRIAGHKESFEDYQRYGQELGIEVKGLPAEGEINSSLIRQMLREGRIDEANKALGHPYTVSGTVVSGEHIGTHLGFPTANLQPDDPNKLIPADGVYAVKARLEDSLEQKHAIANIGQRPTFNGKQTTLETHILRHDGKLYGQYMTVSFIHRLRDEQRFDSPEALAAQLRQDAETAENLLNQEIDKV